MKKNLINEIHRISKLMGSKSLVSEQAVPKFLKSLLNLSDDITKKVLKSSDIVSDDVLRKAKAGEPLSDDAVELLLRNFDFNRLAKTIIDNQLMGNQYLNKIDDIIEIIKKNPDQTNVILNRVDNVIDELSFLSDAPDELVRAIKSETKDRITRGVSPETSRVVDDIFDNVAELLDDIPAGSVSDEMANITSQNIKNYEQFMIAAKEKGSLVQTFSQKQYDDAVSDLAVGDITFIKKIFGFVSNDIEELTQSNVKEYLIDTYPIDEPSFNNEYAIYISDDKKTARVRGPKNFKVSISDNKIIAEEI